MSKLDKKSCKTNETHRKGYNKEGYKRKGYYTCPKGEAGQCEKSEKIYHPPTIIESTKIEGNCIPKQGKPEKTPESEKFAVHTLKGGLKQYFPNDTIEYDMESCVNAGIKAKKIGDTDYQALSQRFVYYENLNKYKIDTDKIEGCREAFLIGYDPSKDPKSKSRSQSQINLDKAREIRKKLLK